MTSDNHIEYIKVFMDYTSADMPVVYFYETDLDSGRFCRRAIEILIDRQVNLIEDLYQNVIEAVPIPTKVEFDAGLWGDEFHALIISQDEFEEIWKSGAYQGKLSAT